MKHDLDAEILDCHGERLGWDTLAEAIREKQPDVVGVSASMTCFHNDYLRLIKLVKEVNPHIVTVGGGIHFSLIAEEMMQACAELDFLVRGEGEFTLLELLEELEKGAAANFRAIRG